MSLSSSGECVWGTWTQFWHWGLQQQLWQQHFRTKGSPLEDMLMVSVTLQHLGVFFALLMSQIEKQFPKKKLKMKSRLQFWPIRSLCAMGSSKILIHAEAAPSAAGLWSSAGQQRVGHHSCPAPVLHQEAPQAVQVSQPHVRHQVWGENSGGSLRLIQVRKSQSIQTQRGSHQWGGGGGGGRGKGVKQWRREQGLGVQRGGGGLRGRWVGGGRGEAMDASLKLQLLQNKEIRVCEAAATSMWWTRTVAQTTTTPRPLCSPVCGASANGWCSPASSASPPSLGLCAVPSAACGCNPPTPSGWFLCSTSSH